MAEFVKVMRDAKRLCLKQDCETCQSLFSGKCLLSRFLKIDPKEIEEGVEQWAESHPEKTSLDVLQKVFSKAKLNDNCCLITVFGVSKDCKECMKNICGDSCRERIDTFLNSPYEKLEEKK